MWEELVAKGIKAYYKDDAVFIINADCRDVLPLLSNNSIDLVLTDPPYGISLNLEWLSEIHLTQGKPSNKTDRPIIGDTGIDLSFLWQYPKRIIFGFPYIYDKDATGWLTWDKQPGLLDTDRTMTTPIEMASSTTWKGFRLVRCMWAGFMRDNGEYRFEHPTQKPQKVIAYCVNKASKSNDLILDPFLGSGTTAYCAKKLGRKCIGIEMEEKYCEIAARRCSQMVLPLEVK
jgi:DNA modification methylase